jgi:hypothetical protein
MEIIGRLITMTVLMLLACGMGLVCSLLVFALVRKRSWKKPTIVAGLFPPAVMAYLLACLILSGIVSIFVGTPDILFGDINESLPNGYHLHALDKMPVAGSIQKSGDSLAVVGWVGKLQTSGPLVLGKYDYTYFPRTTAEGDRNFFLFDTRSGAIENFATEAQLANAAHTSLHLISTPSFHGPKTAFQVISMDAMLLITFVPPAALTIWLIWRLRGFLKMACESTHP